MKRSIAIILSCIIIAGGSAFSFGNETISNKTRAKLGLAMSLTSLKKYDEAIKILKDLRKELPDDEIVEVELISSLYQASLTKEADAELANILIEKMHDTKAALRLAGIMSDRKRYGDAIDICKTVLVEEPDNRDAKLLLARLFSWKGQYGSSLKAYDDIISKFPDWIVPRIEKARVLGWDHQYSKSIKEYKDTVEEVKAAGEAVRLEMAAKDDYYKFFDLKAMKDYGNWLAAEPDNLESLFDLAQIYSKNMQWGKARELYGRVLKKHPYHPWANTALDKVGICSKSVSGEAGFEHYEASSTSRDIDEDYWDIYAKARAPITENLYLIAREDTILYRPSTAKPFEREKMSMEVEYNQLPMLLARAAYALSLYTGLPKDSNDFSGEVNFRPVDPALFSFLYKREDVEDNPQTMIRNLRRDDYKIRAAVTPNRRITFGADYTYSHFTDGNNKFIYGADVKALILYEPHSLAVTYRYEEYGYSGSRDYYFTPGSFHYNTATVEWREFLNKILVWGNRETYYTLKYAFNVDVHDQIGHYIYADFKHDWNSRLSTYVEWAKKIYEHRSTYGDEHVLVYTKLYF